MNDDELAARLRALDADAWDAAPPPPLRFLPAPDEAPSPRRRLLRLRPAFALAATVALLAIGGVAGVLTTREDGPGGARVALAALADEPAGVRARVELPGHRGGDVRLRVDGARPTPAGHVEELWFMTDAKRLVSVGTYVVGADGHADVTFHTGEDPYAYRYVDVSVEPKDGDPAHSERSVLRSRPL